MLSEIRTTFRTALATAGILGSILTAAVASADYQPGWHYHTNIQYYVQLQGRPSTSIDGRYGYSYWIYTNPMTNVTDPNGSFQSSQAHWVRASAESSSGYLAFGIQTGHLQFYNGTPLTYVEVWDGAVHPTISCRNGSSYNGYSNVQNCQISRGSFGISDNMWYQVKVGDYFEDNRWKTGLMVNGYMLVVIDYDLGNTGGMRGLTGVVEFINNSGTTLNTLYNRGERFGASFDSFWAATINTDGSYNGMNGPFEEITSRSQVLSDIRDFAYNNIKRGRVGCDVNQPEGDAAIRQITDWRSPGTGYRTGSHAHGTYPPIWGYCYADGTIP